MLALCTLPAHPRRTSCCPYLPLSQHQPSPSQPPNPTPLPRSSPPSPPFERRPSTPAPYQLLTILPPPGQSFLPPHSDNAHLSLTVALNPRSAFDGGGTRFESTGLVISPEAGHVVCFPGSLRHAGHPITRGRRYVIAAFLWVDGFDEPKAWAEE